MTINIFTIYFSCIFDFYNLNLMIDILSERKDMFKLEKYIEIDEEIKYILNIFSKHSQIYIVGGYIRDKLLNLPPKDCDFCCDLPMDKMLEITSEFNPKIVSEKLNIINFKINNKKFELARMRNDKLYFGSRKNFNFEFTKNIFDDLKRRDLTINALAYDNEHLFYFDENQIKDLKNRNLSFIGNVKTRIEEDPYRILRLFRLFSENSSFKISQDTLNSIKNNKNLLWELPVEMIQKDFINILKNDNYLNTFKIFNEILLFDEIFCIDSYQKEYNARILSLFKNSDLSLLKKLNISEKNFRKLL